MSAARRAAAGRRAEDGPYGRGPALDRVPHDHAGPIGRGDQDVNRLISQAAASRLGPLIRNRNPTCTGLTASITRATSAATSSEIGVSQ